MKKRGLDRRAQVTLFIIFGILIFVGVIALFLVLPTPEFLRFGVSQDPMQEIRPCISEEILRVLPEFQENGFYFDLSNERTIFYEDQDVPYHCYTSQKTTICTRNDAQVKSRIENLLKNRIETQVDSCFQNFRNNNRASNIELGSMDFSVEVLPGEIYLRTRRDVSISTGDESEVPERYNNFDVSVNSPLWDFIMISNEILNQEVSCNCPNESCAADLNSLRNRHRDYSLTYFFFGDFQGRGEGRVYTIRDLHQENTIKFAVRNCDKSP